MLEIITLGTGGSMPTENRNLPSIAIRYQGWVLMFDEVSCTIPGASRKEQIVNNVKSSDLPAILRDKMEEVQKVYEDSIKPYVHQLW